MLSITPENNTDTCTEEAAGWQIEEDEGGDECWLYCAVNCFVTWLDGGCCPRRPLPEPAPMPAVQTVPAPRNLDPLCRRIFELLQVQPDLTASELAQRLNIKTARVHHHLRRYTDRLFVATGSKPNTGSNGGPRGRTWRVIAKERA